MDIMFVITADQIDSRAHADLVATAIDNLNNGSLRTVLKAERTAGDEFQVIMADAESTLAGILQLSRSGQWSIGLGTGQVRSPLPSSIREATGPAFIAARRAVDRAKKRQSRFSVESEPVSRDAVDAEALIDLLLALRTRRSNEGWELHDLMAAETLTQAEAAIRLGITPQAVSLRARAAELRTEQAALPSLQRVLERLEGGASSTTKSDS